MNTSNFRKQIRYFCAIAVFLSRKEVLHVPLLEQSEKDRMHVFERQELYLTSSQMHFPKKLIHALYKVQ